MSNKVSMGSIKITPDENGILHRMSYTDRKILQELTTAIEELTYIIGDAYNGKEKA